MLLPTTTLLGQGPTAAERQQVALVLFEKGLAAYEKGNYLEAAEHYVESMNNWGTHQAAANFCNFYLYGQGVEKNYQIAHALCETAGMKSPSALVMLGEMYLLGYGVPPNRSKAIEYYRRGADAGYVHGQFILGALLAEDNDPGSVFWLSKAAEQGYTKAADMLKGLSTSEDLD